MKVGGNSWQSALVFSRNVTKLVLQFPCPYKVFKFCEKTHDMIKLQHTLRYFWWMAWWTVKSNDLVKTFLFNFKLDSLQQLNIFSTENSYAQPTAPMLPRRRFCAAQFEFFCAAQFNAIVKVSHMLTTCPHWPCWMLVTQCAYTANTWHNNTTLCLHILSSYLVTEFCRQSWCIKFDAQTYFNRFCWKLPEAFVLSCCNYLNLEQNSPTKSCNSRLTLIFRWWLITHLQPLVFPTG